MKSPIDRRLLRGIWLALLVAVPVGITFKSAPVGVIVFNLTFIAASVWALAPRDGTKGRRE